MRPLTWPSVPSGNQLKLLVGSRSPTFKKAEESCTPYAGKKYELRAICGGWSSGTLQRLWNSTRKGRRDGYGGAECHPKAANG